MEATSSSVTFADFPRTKQNYIPENGTPSKPHKAYVGKSKVNKVKLSLNATPLRRMGEWVYRSMSS
jgi:hypothetical protein